MRQLREWVCLIRKVIGSLSLDCKDAMEEVMIGWKDRGRGGTTVNLDGTGAVPAEGDMALPLGPGEWEDGLGLPLCVVCQGVCWPLSDVRREGFANSEILGRKDRLFGEDPRLERREVRPGASISPHCPPQA